MSSYIRPPTFASDSDSDEVPNPWTYIPLTQSQTPQKQETESSATNVVKDRRKRDVVKMQTKKAMESFEIRKREIVKLGTVIGKKMVVKGGAVIKGGAVVKKCAVANGGPIVKGGAVDKKSAVVKGGAVIKGGAVVRKNRSKDVSRAIVKAVEAVVKATDIVIKATDSVVRASKILDKVMKDLDTTDDEE